MLGIILFQDVFARLTKWFREAPEIVLDPSHANAVDRTGGDERDDSKEKDESPAWGNGAFLGGCKDLGKSSKYGSSTTSNGSKKEGDWK
jgi:hypothetical protein